MIDSNKERCSITITYIVPIHSRIWQVRQGSNQWLTHVHSLNEDIPLWIDRGVLVSGLTEEEGEHLAIGRAEVAVIDVRRGEEKVGWIGRRGEL